MPLGRGRGSARGSEQFSKSGGTQPGVDARHPGIRGRAIGLDPRFLPVSGAAWGGDRRSRHRTAQQLDVATLEQRIAEAVR